MKDRPWTADELTRIATQLDAYAESQIKSRQNPIFVFRDAAHALRAAAGREPVAYQVSWVQNGNPERRLCFDKAEAERCASNVTAYCVGLDAEPVTIALNATI